MKHFTVPNKQKALEKTLSPAEEFSGRYCDTYGEENIENNEDINCTPTFNLQMYQGSKMYQIKPKEHMIRNRSKHEATGAHPSLSKLTSGIEIKTIHSKVVRLAASEQYGRLP